MSTKYIALLSLKRNRENKEKEKDKEKEKEKDKPKEIRFRERLVYSALIWAKNFNRGQKICKLVDNTGLNQRTVARALKDLQGRGLAEKIEKRWHALEPSEEHGFVKTKKHPDKPWNKRFAFVKYWVPTAKLTPAESAVYCQILSLAKGHYMLLGQKKKGISKLLGISKNTVKAAYKRLIELGLIKPVDSTADCQIRDLTEEKIKELWRSNKEPKKAKVVKEPVIKEIEETIKEVAIKESEEVIKDGIKEESKPVNNPNPPAVKTQTQNEVYRVKKLTEAFPEFDDDEEEEKAAYRVLKACAYIGSDLLTKRWTPKEVDSVLLPVITAGFKNNNERHLFIVDRLEPEIRKAEAIHAEKGEHRSSVHLVRSALPRLIEKYILNMREMDRSYIRGKSY